MTNRELLELAAKAAGYTLAEHQDPDANALWVFLDVDGRIQNFAPLVDDGDAFRLAVKLGIDLTNREWGSKAAQLSHGYCAQELDEDLNAAARRAIVRAAAEIGANP